MREKNSLVKEKEVSSALWLSPDQPPFQGSCLRLGLEGPLPRRISVSVVLYLKQKEAAGCRPGQN